MTSGDDEAKALGARTAAELAADPASVAETLSGFGARLKNKTVEARDKRTGFEIVKSARSLVNELPKSEASLETRDKYVKIAKKLIDEKITTPEELVKQYINPRTYYKNKAALHYFLSIVIKKHLKEADKYQKTDLQKWWEYVDYIKEAQDILESFIDAPPNLPREVNNGAVKRISKRQSLPHGPWREAMCAAAGQSRSPDAAPVLETLSLTGCRPAELVTGVEWSLIDGKLVATITGVKCKADAGQEWRRLVLDVRGQVAEAMAARVEAAGGRLVIAAPSVRRVDKLVKKAAERAFAAAPVSAEPLSAYSFRHQFASDLKACGITLDETGTGSSASMGHRTDATIRQYGTKRRGGGGVVYIESVEVPNEIKHKKRGNTEKSVKPSKESADTPKPKPT